MRPQMPLWVSSQASFYEFVLSLQNIPKIKILSATMVNTIYVLKYIKEAFIYFHSTHFWYLGQKSKNNFIQFLEEMKTRKFASKIYWPLIELAHNRIFTQKLFAPCFFYIYPCRESVKMQLGSLTLKRIKENWAVKKTIPFHFHWWLTNS